MLVSFLYFFWVGLLCGICLCLVFCSDVGVCCLFIVDWLVICVVIGYLWVTGCGGWLAVLFLWWGWFVV